MIQFLKPPVLKEGDRLLIVSPSSEIASFPKRLERGLEALRALGLEPVLSPHALARDGHRAGSAQVRAEDINLGFADPTIKGIVCSTGGWNAISLLGLLDYRLIGRNPKVFVGFSDITTLHAGLLAKSGLVTFHGPTLLPSFGETGVDLQLILQSFMRAVFDCNPIGRLEDPGYSSDEYRFWDRDDATPRILMPHIGPQPVTGGKAEGPLLGGNLASIVGLLGTDYFPDMSGAILLLEEEGGSTPETERHLECLAIHGIFEKVSGLLFGRPCRYTVASPERTLAQILREVGTTYRIPILMNVMTGHADPILTVPLGVNCGMDSNHSEIMILESGVS